MKKFLQILAVVLIVNCFSLPESIAQTKTSQSRAATKAKKTKTSTKKSEKTPERKTSKRSTAGRLPRYFTHLNLTDSQREEIGEIQREYKEQLTELANRLAELKAEQQDELERVLSRTQKVLYDKYLNGTLKVGDRIQSRKKAVDSKSKSKNSRPKGKSDKESQQEEEIQ